MANTFVTERKTIQGKTITIITPAMQNESLDALGTQPTTASTPKLPEIDALFVLEHENTENNPVTKHLVEQYKRKGTPIIKIKSEELSRLESIPKTRRKAWFNQKLLTSLLLATGAGSSAALSSQEPITRRRFLKNALRALAGVTLLASGTNFTEYYSEQKHDAELVDEKNIRHGVKVSLLRGKVIGGELVNTKYSKPGFLELGNTAFPEKL
ncbi:hypothetical protein HUU53_00750 [Candidatus Micrarchaeota archaeon]|nr:hypothetical protein [Candidatus Micrarchaeota archaeon]